MVKKVHYSRFWSDQGRVGFVAQQDSLDLAHQKGEVGYVHVFEKNEFAPYRGFEYRADHEVEPVYIVEVAGKDLPENIEVIDSASSSQ